jgi:hypothetical protein
LLVLVNPNDLENAFQNLKGALEAKQDAVTIKNLAKEVWTLARQAGTPEASEDPDARPSPELAARAREIELYTEYALYAAALQSPPAATADLLSTLEQQNPRSQYLDEAYGRYFLALTQTGAASKIPAIAAKALAQFPNNEDLLLVLADAAMARKQSDRALGYAERLIQVLEKHPRPEGMSAADWQRKRDAALGRGRWIAGMVQSEKNHFYEADRHLRAALPLIQGDNAMLEAALFHLGLANYQLGRITMRKARILEAAGFSEKAAALGGPLAQQAWHNALVMKDEAGRMR